MVDTFRDWFRTILHLFVEPKCDQCGQKAVAVTNTEKGKRWLCAIHAKEFQN